MSADRFALADEPQLILTAQILERSELAHLADARIACIFDHASPLMLRGTACAAFVAQPSVQGPLAAWFEWTMADFCRLVVGDDGPEFVILFDAAWWQLLEPIGRERLVYHELLHVAPLFDENGVEKLRRDGRPLLHLVPHDRELFDLELLRYGSATCGHGDLGAVVKEGDANAARRRMTVVRRRS